MRSLQVASVRIHQLRFGDQRAPVAIVELLSIDMRPVNNIRNLIGLQRSGQRSPEVDARGGVELETAPAEPGRVELQAPGVQRGPDSFFRSMLVEKRVTLDRIADPGEMDPNLMAAATHGPDDQQRIIGPLKYLSKCRSRGVAAHVGVNFIAGH